MPATCCHLTEQRDAIYRNYAEIIKRIVFPLSDTDAGIKVRQFSICQHGFFLQISGLACAMRRLWPLILVYNVLLPFVRFVRLR